MLQGAAELHENQGRGTVEGTVESIFTNNLKYVLLDNTAMAFVDDWSCSYPPGTVKPAVKTVKVTVTIRLASSR